MFLAISSANLLSHLRLVSISLVIKKSKRIKSGAAGYRTQDFSQECVDAKRTLYYGIISQEFISFFHFLFLTH